MIEALKSENIVDQVGGRFKLCVLIQRRLVQLMEGARPLVDRNGRTDLELVIEEIVQNKISYEFDAAGEVDVRRVLGEDAVNEHAQKVEAAMAAQHRLGRN